MSHDHSHRLSQHQRLQRLTTASDILLHPLLVPTLATITHCALFIPKGAAQGYVVAICLGMFLFTAVLPLGVAAAMRHFHATEALWHAYRPKDRLMLTLVYMVFFAFTFSIAKSLHLPSFICIIPTIAVITLLLAFLMGLLMPRLDAHYAAWSAWMLTLLLLGKGIHLNMLPIVCLIVALMGFKGALSARRHRLDALGFLASLMVGMLAAAIAFYTL